MNFAKTRVFKVVLPLILLAGLVYFFRDPLYRTWQYAESRYLPCRSPIIYSLGSFDKRFGISENDFLKAIDRAEQIWGAPIHRQLFAYGEKGNLIINLIYDYRQEATQKLQNLGIVIGDDKSTYDTLKARYDSLKILYSQKKSNLDSMVNSYQTKKDAYDAEVAYWNRRRGVSDAEYNKLEQERTDLNTLAAEINKTQNDLNQLVDNINAVAATLNRLVNELNLQADKYNNIGAQQGGEFEEGRYTESATGGVIDIYQFDDKDKLIRVLAHELGHALGFGHLDNPKAIMYKLNEGVNEKLTSDDLIALKNRCGI